MKRLLQQIGAIILLGVFCLYITPRDYVHHFTGHEDTEDVSPLAGHDHHDHGPSWSDQHRHCEWLHWEMAAFITEEPVIVPAAPYTFAAWRQTTPADGFSYPPYFFSLRAPPAA
ncbi:hypothetical protein ACWKWU_21545 [Chitinophaga lutea]